jgi:hypothetical protein
VHKTVAVFFNGREGKAGGHIRKMKWKISRTKRKCAKVYVPSWSLHIEKVVLFSKCMPGPPSQSVRFWLIPESGSLISMVSSIHLSLPVVVAAAVRRRHKAASQRRQQTDALFLT